MSETADAAPFAVLIVEDDPFYVQVLSTAVQKLRPDPVIWSCASGAEALSYLRTEPARAPDLALVDLGLPDLDGVEVIRAVVARFPLTPVMVVTVAAHRERVMEAIQAGAQGYLLKGDAHLSVQRAIQQLLAGIHPISPILGGQFLALARQFPVASARDAAGLTGKELELLQLMAEGLSYAQSAERMGVALSTVQSHCRSLFRKLKVRNQLHAVAIAREKGLV